MSKKQIAYSILDLAIVSKGYSFKQTFDQSIALAKAAEAAGYSRYWLAEHHNSDAIGSSATSMLIGKIASETNYIKVGSGGIMLPNHSPLIIAEQFGTLGILYPNRIDLGLGRAPGTDQATAAAIRSDFYQAAMSFPNEVQQIQNYFSKENATSKVRANVAEGVNVPLYILGSSTDSAHLAAKKGLPYAFASHFATAHLNNALEIYHQEFKQSSVLEKPYTLAGVNIIVADTDEEAEKISTSLYKMIINLLTGKRDYMQPPMEMDEEMREVIQHPSVHQMLKYSFIGSKETVKKQVKAFIETTQVDEIIAVTNIFSSEDRIKSYQLFAEIMQDLNTTDTKV
jgi:luciferase family oxidoreductase group 1